MKVAHRLRTVVADADPAFLAGTAQVLAEHGLGPVASLDSAARLHVFLTEHPCALAILDFGLVPNGLRLLSDLSAIYPQTAFIVCARDGDIAMAMQCVHHGAYDYLVKPIESTRLVDAAGRALGHGRPAAFQRILSPLGVPTPAEGEAAFADFITEDPELTQSVRYLKGVSRLWAAVLISGPSGSGKHQLARSVHALSGRKGALVEFDGQGLDAAQAASTLFGSSGRAGLPPEPGQVLRASGGTLVVHDVETLSFPVQVSLARLIETNRYYPSDSHVAKASSARVIATSCQSWSQLESSRSVRRDLCYALRAHHVQLSPLHRRSADLVPLTRHLVAQLSTEMGLAQAPALTAEAMAVIASYSFPGNVRELRSLLADCCVLSHGVLDVLPIQRAVQIAQRTGSSDISYGARLPTLHQARNHLVDEALRTAGGNQTQAAALLGISRQAISQLILKRRRKVLNADKPLPASEHA